MGTPLQTVYDAFLGKIDETLIGKESLIYQMFISALTRSKKSVRHSLIYSLTDEVFFDGNFNDVLDTDEIELISMYMVYNHKNRAMQKLEAIQNRIGTKDFNSLPNKANELSQLREDVKFWKQEIKDFEQDFNTYKYDE